VAAKFAAEGYHACLCRRSDQAGLDQMVKNIEEEGGTASGYLINAIEENVLEELIISIEKDHGPIEVLVYNLGAQSGMKLLQETSIKEFEWAWRIADLGLFRVAKTLMPLMEQRGYGTLLVTSATAAMRGNKNQHSHATAMGGRRMLCQTLNAEFAPKGIHVAHIVIDGMVDAPDTLGKMLGEEVFQQLRESRGMEHDGLILPEKIADTYFHLAKQHRSAWTHEIDLRAFSDVAWWNS
ncbi:SDR family oxidoreductase, partial [Gammaproteobacteria bacterium]|nr:SDR family oxidoreductase [Gammaproteobacteria bacterium]